MGAKTLLMLTVGIAVALLAIDLGNIGNDFVSRHS
jgi:hypothetical protein